jgi:HEPN domain
VYGMDRGKLQELSKAKFADAKLLCEAGSYSNAYYLAGYAVELGIKAIIARRFKADTIPDKAFVQETYSHNLQKLIELTGLAKGFRADLKRSADFNSNWGVAIQWTESVRYEIIDASEAQSLINAIGDAETGILQWLMRHW